MDTIIGPERPSEFSSSTNYVERNETCTVVGGGGGEEEVTRGFKGVKSGSFPEKFSSVGG